MEADRNSRQSERNKFISKIPEKALRSTFQIKDDEVRIGATVDSVYADPGTNS